MDKIKVRQLLAATIIAGFFSALFYLFWAAIQSTSFDPNNLLLMMAGGLVAKFSTIVDYFFGTSDSSERKTELIYMSSERKTDILAENMPPKRIKDDEDQ